MSVFYGLQIRILFSDYRELLLSDNNMSFTIVKKKHSLNAFVVSKADKQDNDFLGNEKCRKISMS